MCVDMERNTATWGHCGDSRLYAFRNGQLSLRTRDHSVVQSLVDGGLLGRKSGRGFYDYSGPEPKPTI